jgi:hypothetical protein
LGYLSLSRGLYYSPVIAEVTAAWRAALFCRELDYRKIELEEDALQVMQALRKEDCNLSNYGYITEEARAVSNGFSQ